MGPGFYLACDHNVSLTESEGNEASRLRETGKDTLVRSSDE